MREEARVFFFFPGQFLLLKKKKELGSRQTEAGVCDAMEQQQECHDFRDVPKARRVCMLLRTLHLAGSILQICTWQQQIENEVKLKIHCLCTATTKF